MKPTLFLEAFPWDLPSNQASSALSRLHGEVGVTGLSVWAVCPAVTQLGIAGGSVQLVRCQGGCFVEMCGRTEQPLKAPPAIVEGAGTVGALHEIAEACGKHALDLRLIVSASRMGGLVARHPQFAALNALGITSDQSLCLTNEVIGEVLRDVVKDLAERFTPSAIVLSDLSIGWRDGDVGNVRAPRALGSAEQSLLSMCFCAACCVQAQRGGANADDAASTVRRILDRSLQGDFPLHESLAAVLTEHPTLAAYTRVQCETLSALLGGLVECCKSEIVVSRDLQGHDGLSGQLDPRLPGAILTRLGPSTPVEAAFVPEARRSELHVAASEMIGAEDHNFVKRLSDAVELGCAGVTIDNYAFLSSSGLTRVRQAMRFARRTAAS